MRFQLFALLLAGCAGAGNTQAGSSVAAELRTPDGLVVGQARVSEMNGGLHVRIEARALAPGRYGAHLHASGRCDPPGFESAGAHWNPTARQHGTDNPQGHHLGDLPNIERGEEAAGGPIDVHVPGAALRGADGMMDADGAAVVIHAAPDDYRTDPSGNSGARIACGVLR
jgi:Cu-Zn family superoxide dismutase